MYLTTAITAIVEEKVGAAGNPWTSITTLPCHAEHDWIVFAGKKKTFWASFIFGYEI